jgi:hypothetical protein
MNFNFVTLFGRLTDDHDHSRQKKIFWLSPYNWSIFGKKKKKFFLIKQDDGVAQFLKINYFF